MFVEQILEEAARFAENHADLSQATKIRRALAMHQRLSKEYGEVLNRNCPTIREV